MKFTMRYGIDAPFWVFSLMIVGFVFTLLGVLKFVHPFVLGYGLICLVIGLWMFFYSTIIKVAHREVILNFAQVKAEDELLDVGTGRGLIAIGAAKRACKVTAIDYWSKWDLAGNSRAALQANIEAENVENIKFLEADARDIPYADESFDVVISNFVLHNIKNKKERGKVIQEMWRVLRSNGKLVISDIGKTTASIQTLEELSHKIEKKRFYYTFPFSRTIIIHKENNETSFL